MPSLLDHVSSARGLQTACRLCSGADEWIKSCIRSKHCAPGSEWWPHAFRICGPCYEARRAELLLVQGPFVVTARCVRCGTYSNPRDFEDVRPAGKKDCYGGVCRECDG